MSAGAWVVTLIAETFTAPVREEMRRIDRGLSTPKSEQDEDQLSREFHELRAFIQAYNRLGKSPDPMSSLTEVRNDAQSSASHFELRVPPWRGIYRVDLAKKLCVGVSVEHDSDRNSPTVVELAVDYTRK